MSRKSLEFFVNYGCNAKCPFCFNPPDASPELERGLPFAELARRLYAGREQGYGAVKFIGGEATLREDLPNMVALARRVGYESVQLTTNGIRLADADYARKLFELGVDSFRFSVHGHTPELHDRLVAVPGALQKIERAAATLQALGATLGINYVLNRINAPEFSETCLYFARRLRIDDVIVYFMRYQGFGALPANREMLKIGMPEAAVHVRRAFAALRAAGSARLPALIHFVPCVLPELAEHMLDWTRDPEDCGQGNSIEDKTTLPDGSSGPIHDVTNSGKRPVAACARCVHGGRCLGVEANYLALFGEAGFSPVPSAAGKI